MTRVVAQSEIPSCIAEQDYADAKAIIQEGWYFLPAGTPLREDDRGWYYSYSYWTLDKARIESASGLPGWTPRTELGSKVGCLDFEGNILIGLRRRPEIPERFRKSAASWQSYLEKESEVT